MREDAKRYGASLTTNPYTALLDEVSRTAGHVAWLGQKVAEAESDDHLLAFDGDSPAGPWLGLYRAERAHLVRVAESAIRMGIAEREVRLAEQQGQLLAWVVGKVVAELGLGPEDQDRVPGLVRRFALEAKAVEEKAPVVR